MIKSYLCGLLMGIAIMNTINGIRGFFAAKECGDKVGILLAGSVVVLGVITLAIQIWWLLMLIDR